MSFTPNTTPTPNWLYNGEMKKMNETELKVVLLVTRKTLGWFDPMTKSRKSQDYISQSQFIQFTGQNSSASIARAIQSCVVHGWIIAKNKDGVLCDTPEKRRRNKIWYQLGNIFIDKISPIEESSQDNLVHKMSKSSSLFDDNLIHKVNNTKETLTKEINTSTPSDDGDTSLISNLNPIETESPAQPPATPNLKRPITYIQDYFAVKCLEVLDEKPIYGRADYAHIANLYKKGYLPSQLREIIDWYFENERNPLNLIQIKTCLSNYRINTFKVAKKL